MIKVYHGTNSCIGYGILRAGSYVAKNRKTAEFYGEQVYEIEVNDTDIYKCQYDMEISDDVDIDSYKTKIPLRIKELSPMNGII